MSEKQLDKEALETLEATCSYCNRTVKVRAVEDWYNVSNITITKRGEIKESMPATLCSRECLKAWASEPIPLFLERVKQREDEEKWKKEEQKK